MQAVADEADVQRDVDIELLHHPALHFVEHG